MLSREYKVDVVDMEIIKEIQHRSFHKEEREGERG